MTTGIRSKDVTIRIKPFENAMDEAINVMWNLKQGKKVKPKKPTLTFPDLETLRTILTDERLRLLQTVNEKKPKSLYELAQLLNRKYPNVYTDAKKLEELGLIELRGHNNQNQPLLQYEKIRIEIPLTIPA
jgi:predicted transcriptional regulator